MNESEKGEGEREEGKGRRRLNGKESDPFHHFPGLSLLISEFFFLLRAIVQVYIPSGEKERLRYPRRRERTASRPLGL